jgi:hypothetical protein
MKMIIDHIYETLKVAIDIATAGTGGIQERLAETGSVIHSLNMDEFPLELRDDFSKLSDALSTPQQSAIDPDARVRAVGHAGVGCDEVEDEQALALALLIVQLFVHTSA